MYSRKKQLAETVPLYNPAWEVTHSITSAYPIRYASPTKASPIPGEGKSVPPLEWQLSPSSWRHSELTTQVQVSHTDPQPKCLTHAFLVGLPPFLLSLGYSRAGRKRSNRVSCFGGRDSFMHQHRQYKNARTLQLPMKCKRIQESRLLSPELFRSTWLRSERLPMSPMLRLGT